MSVLNPYPFTAEGLFPVSALVSAVLLALGFAAADSLDSTEFSAWRHLRTAAPDSAYISEILTQVGIGKFICQGGGNLEKPLTKIRGDLSTKKLQQKLATFSLKFFDT